MDNNVFETHTLISLEFLLRMLKEYDCEYGMWPNSQYEGRSVAEFINYKLSSVHNVIPKMPWLTPLCEYDAEPRGHSIIMTIDDFKDKVENMVFCDYDGLGYPMKDGKMCNSIIIRPSRLFEIPDDATHIAWYNR